MIERGRARERGGQERVESKKEEVKSRMKGKAYKMPRGRLQCAIVKDSTLNEDGHLSSIRRRQEDSSCHAETLTS